MATNSTARISVLPEVDKILDEWADRLLISKTMLVRRIAIDNLDQKTLDFYESTKKKRSDPDQRKANVKLWLSFSELHASAIEKAAERNRTFFVDWVEEVVESHALKWKEAQNVVKPKNRQPAESRV